MPKKVTIPRGWTKAKITECEDELCCCGHLKNAQHGSGFAGSAGHGVCNVAGCECRKFTWAGFVKKAKAKMKTWDVGIREVHVNTIQVRARDRHEAMERAEAEAQSGEMNLEYSHTMDKCNWTLEEVVK